MSSFDTWSRLPNTGKTRPNPCSMMCDCWRPAAATDDETSVFCMGARAPGLPRPCRGMGSRKNFRKWYSNKHQPNNFFYLFPGLYNLFQIMHLHICAHFFAPFYPIMMGGTWSRSLWLGWGCWWLNASKFGGCEKVKHSHARDFAAATRYLS